jgi:dihydrofolate reductase
MMRKIIAALQVSLESFIEGPNGEMDWVMVEDEEVWKDLFEMLAHVDTFILGRKMYPGYEQYWLAVLEDPDFVALLQSIKYESCNFISDCRKRVLANAGGPESKIEQECVQSKAILNSLLILS